MNELQQKTQQIIGDFQRIIDALKKVQHQDAAQIAEAVREIRASEFSPDQLSSDINDLFHDAVMQIHD